MDIEETVRGYLAGLEEGDLNSLMKIFSENAIVHSPLSGKVKASLFYRDLFEKTRKSKIELLNIFTSKCNQCVGAGHFLYDWTLENGDETSFECVDIFQFSPDGKIKELKIIYDTCGIREGFEDLKNRI